MAQDPGRQYLYNNKQGQGEVKGVSQNPAPRHSSERDRWDVTLGNIADASVLYAKLQNMLSDALFLDEDTFNGKKDVQHYVQKLQVATLRVKELEGELQAALGALTEKDSHMDELRLTIRKLNDQLKEEREMQDNNLQVFKVHAEAIREKNEEIERLKAVIEGLTS